jgi:hypothetical protein
LALLHDRARSDKERLLVNITLGQRRPYYTTARLNFLGSGIVLILYSLNLNIIKKNALSPCSLSHFNRAEFAAITNCALEMSLIRLPPQVEAHCNEVNEVTSCHIETDLGWCLVWRAAFFEFGWLPMLLSVVCLSSPTSQYHEGLEPSLFEFHAGSGGTSRNYIEYPNIRNSRRVIAISSALFN